MARPILAILLLALTSACTPRATLTTPDPLEVQGEAHPDTVLTVRGHGFGPRAPDVVLYEDFLSAPRGESVATNGPVVGRWSAASNDPLIVGGGRSGDAAMQSYDGERQRQLRLELPGREREIFVSFWVRIPPDTHFPGDVDGPREFSSNSSWKLAWLMDTERGFEDDERYDICLPTFTGQSGFQLAGNTFHAGNRFLPDSWWSWDGWTRIAVWIRDPLDKEPGGVFEAVSAQHGHFLRTFGAPQDRLPWEAQVFDRLNIPGWIQSGGGEAVGPLYDDIYVAVGHAAAARVELADDPRYERAQRHELLLPESWHEEEIRVRVPRGLQPLEAGRDWYLFVTNENGERNRRGLRVCVGCVED